MIARAKAVLADPGPGDIPDQGILSPGRSARAG